MNKCLIFFDAMVLAGLLMASCKESESPGFNVSVEAEEVVYEFVSPDNGSNPMWCSGNTCIVRSGDKVFTSGMETLVDQPPRHNTRWMMFERSKYGWELLMKDEKDRTREPSPLGLLGNGKVLLSVNPTLTAPGVENGPAEPRVLVFDWDGHDGDGDGDGNVDGDSDAADGGIKADIMRTPYKTLMPIWDGYHKFTEHSYRSFAVDAAANEFILFQNDGDTAVAWTFYDDDGNDVNGNADMSGDMSGNVSGDRNVDGNVNGNVDGIVNSSGNWLKHGTLYWPWGETYEVPEPIRICYPAVQLKNREVHFLGVSDIVEPVKAWKDYKFGLTGRKWDYDFRRLFYTWTSDIVSKPFQEWVEISSRETTAGHISPCDLWVAPDGLVHILWEERAIDERLREEFFPDSVQSYALNYAIIKEGEVIYGNPIMICKVGESGYETDELLPGRGRFHTTPGGHLYVFYYVHNQTGDFHENRIVEILPDHNISAAVKVELKRPFSNFFTATIRGGSAPSDILDIFGKDDKNEMRYARIRILTGAVADK